MPSRVVRAGLLSSEAVSQLDDRTFRLFVALLLSADDFGLVEVGYGPIREATALLEGWSRESVARMLVELIDAGLLLPYEVGGKRYAAVAKWESHINSRAPKFPLPSWGTAHVRKALGFKDVQTRLATAHLFRHLTVSSGAPVGHQWATGGAPVPEEVRGKRVNKGTGSSDAGSQLFEGESARPWDCPPDVDGPAWKDWLAVRKKKRCATSPRAWAGVQSTLAALRDLGCNVSECVARSADKGWSDLYPPASNGKPPAGLHGRSAPAPSVPGSFDTTGAMFAPPSERGAQ